MKRRCGGFAKRKPIVQLDDVPKENFGLGFKKETEYEEIPRSGNDFNDRSDSNAQGSEDPLNAVQFVKSEQKTELAPEDLDSKLNDFFKEINELVVEGPSLKKIKPDEVLKSQAITNTTKEPIPPTCAWQAVLDESSQCCYYWNVDTNQSTWEEPSEYTEYLVKYRQFEEEYAAYTAKGNEQKKFNDGSGDVSKTKQSSPSLVPYECFDETAEEDRPDLGTESDDQNGDFGDGQKEGDARQRASKKRQNEVDGIEDGVNCSKRMKLNDNTLASILLGQQEIEEKLFQIEEARRLLHKICQKLEDCDRSLKINGFSVEHIQGSLQTRVEDWKAGYLPTSYLISKLQEWLDSVQEFKEEERDSKSSPLKDEDQAQKQDNAAHEPNQPPLPPPMECAPPPPPEVEEVMQPSTTRSLISVDYGEDTDEDDNNADSEANTEPSLSRNSSPFPPLEEADAPASAGNTKVKTSVKKSKPLITDSISMRKKKVSSMVEKWQKIQQELEQ